MAISSNMHDDPLKCSSLLHRKMLRGPTQFVMS